VLWPREREFDEAIAAASTQTGVPAALIKAIIARESAFNPRAERYEPLVKDRRVGGKLAPGPDTSRGLMQLLEFRARELGFTGSVDRLFDPWTNVHYGTRLLRGNLERAGGDWNTAISAYNAGWILDSQGRETSRPKRRADGMFVNQRYVDDVRVYYGYFAGQLPEADARRYTRGQVVAAALPTVGVVAIMLLLALVAWRS
jgi:soluble lytic murein transglycosylase-like protein